MEKELDGVFNVSADKIPRKNVTWSDTNLDDDYSNWKESFDRLQCRNCGGILFEVMHTGDYETSARCSQCGMWYIVHTG